MIHFHEMLIYTFLSVFSMVNPIAMSSVFLAITKDYPHKLRRQLAYRVAIYGTILLIAVLFFGDYVLNFFGISLPFVQIAGGLVVCFSALEMLNTKPKISSDEEEEASQNTEVAFFPLTMPITAGPGAIAITLTVANSFQETSHLTAFFNYIAAVSVGIYRGQPVLDLDYAEDVLAETDMNVVMNEAGQFIEIQGTAEDGSFNRNQLNDMLGLAESGILNLIELQKNA